MTLITCKDLSWLAPKEKEIPPLPHQGPVVRKAVSANPGLKIKLGFDFSCIKAYVRYNVLWGFILVSGKTEGNKIYIAKLSANL